AAQRVLRGVPRSFAPARERAHAGLRRRAGQVDGAQRGRARLDRGGEHAPAGPPDRSGADPLRPAAPGPLGARARSAPGRERAGRVSAREAFDLKHRSRALTEGPERAAARAYLHGIGYSAEDLAKPLVGVAHSWIETMPCNFNNRVLAAQVKEGIRAAGGTPMELNTIAISDGIKMGRGGMWGSPVWCGGLGDAMELGASARRARRPARLS